MENPYQPPTQNLLHPSTAFHWMRIAAWSVLIFVITSLIAVISGLTMSDWEIYGDTIEEAVVNARLIRRILYGASGAFLYWQFAIGLTSRRLLHVAALFALIQIIDMSILFLFFSTPMNELFDSWAMARSLLAAAIGLGIAGLGAKNPPEPDSLR